MKITRKQIRKLITEVRMVQGGGMPVKSRANSEFAAIIKGKKVLKEYSDYPSWADISDQMDDITEMIDMLTSKYIVSGWLYQGENKGNAIAEGVGKKMEQLYRDSAAIASLIQGSGVLMRESKYDSEADEWYEYRHGADQEDMEYYIAVSLENAARANSGVNGQNLLKIARQDPEYSSVLQGIPDEKMWEVADTMIEDDTLFFDVEEDAWYYAPEMR